MSKFSFKTRARIINQLGEQLIKNESIALLELIKNAYDADASYCHVELFNPEIPKDGQISITDDGRGMDGHILRNAWLEIGTNYKEELSQNSIYRSPKYNRIPLGEKGIGRLGVHRLGNKIEIVTRKENCKECVLNIDWNKLEQSKYIEDFSVSIMEREPTIFIGNSGTKITVKELKAKWTKKLTRDSFRAITSLNSPFESDDSFKVEFKTDNKWLEGLYTYDEIKEHSLYSFDIEIAGNQLKKFDYEFNPWPTMKKLKKRTVTIKDKEISSLLRMVRKIGKDYIDIDLNQYKIGKVRFRGLIFDRDPRILNLGVQDKMGLRKYLNENGGVRVFRDNMRVMDYGEQGDDWLDMEGRRINAPAKSISKNLVLAAVYLDREASGDLKEKTNREGFVENEAYQELYYAIRYAIEKIESLRQPDKELLRFYYGPQNTNEPVISTMAELKQVIEEKVADGNTKRQIYSYLTRIDKEYEYITDTLIKSAGAGLNLTIVIHQIEKIIKEIQKMLLSNASYKIIEKRVLVLAEIIEGYSVLVKSSDIKSRDLVSLVNQSLFNIDFRLDAHGIKLENNINVNRTDLKGLCSESHVMNALLNIFDNSIFWLGYSKTKKPSIYVDITDQYDSHVSIVIADNGPGFNKSHEELIKPFISDKPGGMGIGLALTNEIMNALKGKLIFDVNEYFEIPEKYKKGAAVALAFKQER